MKSVHKIVKYLLPIVFIILLILPFTNSQLELWTFERKDENRQFRDSLSIDINKLDFFPKEAESYLNDNFSFRTPLLNLYHEIKFSYFKISPHPKKTIVGNDDWFFVAGKEKDIYEGNRNFSKLELNQFSTEWKKRKKYLDSLNIKTYWVIAPFKHYVYNEKLPFNIYAHKKRRVDQLKEHFEENLPNLIIDPILTLRKNKEERKLFYKMDNHWNYHSGYLTTKLLLNKIKKDFPNIKIEDISPHIWKEKTVYTGIHYNVIGIEDLSEIRQMPIFNDPKSAEDKKYGFKYFEDWAYPSEFEKRYTNKKIKSGLKILFIRDSFGNQLIPFVSEVFKESVFIFDSWQYGLNQPIIEIVKPDIVVFLGLETHLDNIIKDY
jgi:hypothetical protein|tara:strand:+ start:4082 stop:5212 length:1131 start_codon:yes stop_codon:yes gene_type:complete